MWFACKEDIMENVLNVAQFIIDEYYNITKTKIDEMKLHKLLYFAQRECIAITGKPLFQEGFEGWKYGPVCKEVRSQFYGDELNCETSPVSDEAAYILRNVILSYGELASWKLSQMSHQELSWKNARQGLKDGENGSKELKIDDIFKDAEKVRPYDHVWDMYYDEFDDVEEI